MSAAHPFKFAASYNRPRDFRRAQARAAVQALRKAKELKLGVVHTANDSGIAACLLDGMADKAIAKATGISLSMVELGVRKMKHRAGVDSRVSLALVLYEQRYTTP